LPCSFALLSLIPSENSGGKKDFVSLLEGRVRLVDAAFRMTCSTSAILGPERASEALLGNA
jgi:hypothetical protein